MIDQNNRGGGRGHEQYMPDASRLGGYMHSPAPPGLPMSGMRIDEPKIYYDGIAK